MNYRSKIPPSIKLIGMSTKETFLSSLKQKEITFWTIIVPIMFSFLINIVNLLRGSTTIETPRQGIITIGIISFSVIMLNSSILSENIITDKNSAKSSNLFSLLGKMLAFLVYTFLSVLLLLIFGFIMGSSFNLSLNQVFSSFYLLILLVIASWGIGLIFSFILRNNRKFIGVISVIPISTVIFFLLSAIRTNFFNRFPQIVLNLININPFTLSPSMIVQLLVGEGWIVIFDPLSSISIVISLLLPIILFLIGLFLYTRMMISNRQIVTQKVEVLSTEESESFFGMTKSAVIVAMFPPILILTEGVFILLIFVLPFSIDIFLARMLVVFLSSILGVLIIYLILIRLLHLNTPKNSETPQLPPLKNLKWTFIIFSLLWMSISIITIILNGLSSIFNVNLPLFSSFDFLPVNDVNNVFMVLFWLLSSTVILASLKEVWYRRTLLPLLEQRGISTSLSLLSISIFYGILHTVLEIGLEVRILQTELISLVAINDLSTTIVHGLHVFIFGFSLSLACGIIYIITRNILYSIIIHSLTNLLILLTYYIPILNIPILVFVFSIGMIILISGGLFIILNSLIHEFPALPSYKEWKEISPKFLKSQVNKKFIGFFLISTVVQGYLLYFQSLGIPGLVYIGFNILFFIVLLANAISIYKTPNNQVGVQEVN